MSLYFNSCVEKKTHDGLIILCFCFLFCVAVKFEEVALCIDRSKLALFIGGT